MERAGILRRNLTAAALGALLSALLTPLPATAGAAVPAFDHPYRSGVVLVGFRHATPQADRERALRDAGVARSEQLTPLATDARIAHLGVGIGVPEAIAALLRNPGVRYAEPDYVVADVSTSNDTYYTNGSLWGMYGDATSPTNQYGSQAGEAWAAGATGSRTIYVGDIDSGIDYTHPDLAGNVGNPNEIAGNGVDDDGNGLVDDRYGYDFVHNDADPMDDYRHGTHTAGTIGALGGNGVGVAGVNWYVKVIAAKFLDSSGYGYLSDATRATDYFTTLKARGLNVVATNNSWGGGGFDQSLLDAINRGGNAGILYVAAAGNSSYNNDTTDFYPSNYTCTTPSRAWDCLISVAAITNTGTLASYSDYGATKVDLGAPGSGVWSTVPGGYRSLSGTSMATPHVTGAVALCASLGTTSASSIRSAILASVTATSSLSGKTVSGGRLNIGNLVPRCTSGGAASHQLAVTVSGAGSGSVTSNPAGIACSTGQTGTCSMTGSGSVTLTASAASGSAFGGWTNCPAPSGTGCTVTLDQDVSVTATFNLTAFTLSLSLSKPGRTAPSVTVAASSYPTYTCSKNNCSYSYAPSTLVTLTAVSDVGATFTGWSGACTGSALTCTVTMSQARTVTATFSK